MKKCGSTYRTDAKQKYAYCSLMEESERTLTSGTLLYFLKQWYYCTVSNKYFNVLQTWNSVYIYQPKKYIIRGCLLLLLYLYFFTDVGKNENDEHSFQFTREREWFLVHIFISSQTWVNMAFWALKSSQFFSKNLSNFPIISEFFTQEQQTVISVIIWLYKSNFHSSLTIYICTCTLQTQKPDLTEAVNS